MKMRYDLNRWGMMLPVVLALCLMFGGSAFGQAAPAKAKMEANQETAGPGDAAGVPSVTANPSPAAKLFDTIEVETFNRLKDLGFSPYVPPMPATSSTTDYKVALNMGVAVADALATAVNHQESNFLKLAGMVHTFGKTLGVQEAVLARYTKITEATQAGEWKHVEKLIYELKDNITMELHKQDMEENAILAMVSGWLEGLYIVSKSLDGKYKDEASNLLGDRTFVEYLTKYINKLGKDVQEKAEIKAIKEALPKIDAVLNRPVKYVYNQEDVTKIINLLEPLRQKITS